MVIYLHVHYTPWSGSCARRKLAENLPLLYLYFTLTLLHILLTIRKTVLMPVILITVFLSVSGRRSRVY
jgi:hypothetical protein